MQSQASSITSIDQLDDIPDDIEVLDSIPSIDEIVDRANGMILRHMSSYAAWAMEKDKEKPITEPAVPSTSAEPVSRMNRVSSTAPTPAAPLMMNSLPASDFNRFPMARPVHPQPSSSAPGSPQRKKTTAEEYDNPHEKYRDRMLRAGRALMKMAAQISSEDDRLGIEEVIEGIRSHLSFGTGNLHRTMQKQSNVDIERLNRTYILSELPPVRKNGWLTKRGHKRKNWLKRWFVLDNCVLSYYAAPTDSEPKGTIPLEMCTTEIDTTVGKEHTMAIRIPGDPVISYYLQAQSEAEIHGWLDACLRSRRWLYLMNAKTKHILDRDDFIYLYSLWNDLTPLPLRDESRTMDEIQFKNALERMDVYGLGALKETNMASRLFHFLDIDVDNLLKFDEFITGISLLCKGGRDARLQLTFLLYDLDGSGWVSKKELNEIIMSGMSMRRTKLEKASMKGDKVDLKGADLNEIAISNMVDSIFAFLDGDGDGCITLDEMKKWVKLHEALSALFEVL